MTSRVSIPLTICILAAGIAIALLARGPSAPDTGTATAPASHASHEDAPTDGGGVVDNDEPGTIRIESFAFSDGLTVAPGATIAVRNADGAPHTVTSSDGLFDTGTIDGGGQGSFTAPTEPGTYAFFCEVHPSMTGTFTVAA